MSNQSDARKGEVAGDECKPRSGTKRSRKRPWIIECRWKLWQRPWGEWHKWSAYETKARRDMAFVGKDRPDGFRTMQFRKVDP